MHRVEKHRRTRRAWIVAIAPLGALGGCLPGFHGEPVDASIDAGERDASRESSNDGTAGGGDATAPLADGGTCPDGQAPCANGCRSLDQPATCGSCTNDCTKLTNVDPSGVACQAGRCTYACQPGYADCTDSGTGCATNLSDPGHCGTCPTACDDASVCAPSEDGGTDASAIAFACVSTCPSNAPTLCAGSCANETNNSQTNASNCGGCGTAFDCSGGMTCQDAGCACPAGEHVCSGSCVSNGSPNNCGPTSCTGCPEPANGSATCDGTSCGITCGSGFNPCGNSCVNEQTDPNNCGSCGNSCLDSTCSSGSCVPVTLAMGQDQCAIAVDGTNVYWWAVANAVLYVPIAGGAVQTVPQSSILSAAFQSTGIASDPSSSYVYWNTNEGVTGSSVMGWSRVGVGGAFSIDSNSAGTGIAASGSNAYWIDSVQNANLTFTISIQYYVPSTGTTTVASGIAGATQIAGDANFAYWTDAADGTVLKAPNTGTGPVTTLASNQAPDLIAVDGTNVYWENGSTIMSVPKSSTGSATPTTLASGHSFDGQGGLATDGINVYFSDTNLWKVPVTGGTPTMLPVGGVTCGIAVDSNYVYYSQAGTTPGGPPPGPLMKVAK